MKFLMIHAGLEDRYHYRANDACETPMSKSKCHNSVKYCSILPKYKLDSDLLLLLR